MQPRSPTSDLLEKLLGSATDDHVTLAWLIENLSERSFGIVMLLMGLVALVPGASPVIGVMLAVPAIQMILAHKAPRFPRFIGGRQLPTRRLKHLVGRVAPALRRMERIIRPRWRTPFEVTKRVVGLIVLLLGLTLLAPIPFSHVIPAFVIMLLSFAYLEEDGVALCIALAAALVSLSIAAATVWVTVRGIDFIDRL